MEVDKMATLQKVRLVESNERTITEKAREVLTSLNIKFISLPPDPFFMQRFDLPFLETEDGYRYFGIQGITRFAQHYSEKK
jgi:hypothetical protein